MHTFKNPIIPGFYPDPSITKKGKDFYLVCSTFNYFPGIPVFHSQDLVHWEQEGNVITRDAQAPLGEYQAYAATIRYRSRDDLFYVVTTLVKPGSYHENINVYYTASNPNGPWSDAHVIKGAEGIDPTLVFDGPDIWYLGNMRVEPENEKNTSRWIWLQKLDVQTGMLAGEKHILRKDGALYGAMCPEGPHIYQKGNWYYLLIAEGGTKHNHAVSVFRSKAITGPYEGDPRNPVLTHRNLSMDSPINSVGHADLIETEKGTWAVCLGVRPCGGAMYRNLGRETFLVPVIWEDGWPVFAPKTGHVELEEIAPDLPQKTYPPEATFDDFTKETELAPYWLFPHSFHERPYRFETGGLMLSQTCMLRRLRSMHWRAELAFDPSRGNVALILLADQKNAMRLTSSSKGCLITLMHQGNEETIWRTDKSASTLAIEGHLLDVQFFLQEQGKWIPVGKILDGRILSDYGSFTGNMVGMEATEKACIRSFHIRWLDSPTQPVVLES